MKTIISIFLLSVFLLNPEETTSNDNQEARVLYRNFHNVLVYEDFGLDLKDVTLKAANNVEIVQNEFGQYIANPGHEQVAIIEVHQDNQLVKTVIFHVYNAPRPSLFLCGLEENNSLSSACGVLQVRLPDNITRFAEYTIDSYIYRVESKSLEGAGKGSEISDLDRVYPLLESGDELEIEVMYSDYSGIYRKSTARWFVEK